LPQRSCDIHGAFFERGECRQYVFWRLHRLNDSSLVAVSPTVGDPCRATPLGLHPDDGESEFCTNNASAALTAPTNVSTAPLSVKMALAMLWLAPLVLPFCPPARFFEQAWAGFSGSADVVVVVAVVVIATSVGFFGRGRRDFHSDGLTFNFLSRFTATSTWI